MDGGKYLVNTTTGIEDVIMAKTTDSPMAVYTIDGRIVGKVSSGHDLLQTINSLPKGIYIVNGKKFIR